MTEQTTTLHGHRLGTRSPLEVFRARCCGAALIAAAAMILAGELTTPPRSTNDTKTQAAAFLAHPTLTQVSALLFHFGYLLMLPGIVGLLSLIRYRAVLLGHIGAALAFLGFTSLAGNTLLDLITLAASRELGTDKAVQALDAAGNLPAAGAFVLPAFIGSFLGLAILMVAIGRSAELAWGWVAVTIVGLALVMAAPLHFVTVIGFVALSSGLAGAGARLLRE